MINELQIQNYQSHKDSLLKFSPGVNAIVGASDAGKTAIIRALRWAIENRPAGEAMRSDWGGETRIDIYIDKGNREVSRVRSDKVNAYLDFGGKDEFKAIKSEVPEEIRQALNLTKVNLQYQHDRAFLLTNSSGEVAQHFNNIAKLEAIDRGTKAIQSALRSHEHNIKTGEQHIGELEEGLTEFDYLDEYEKKIIALEKLGEKRNQLESSSAQMERLIAEIQKVEKHIVECKKLTRLSPKVEEVVTQFNQLRGMIVSSNALQNLVDDIEETDKDIEQTGKRLRQKQKEFKENFPDICPLCEQEVKR